MLKITESNYNEKLGLLPKDLQHKLLMLAYDDTFLRIINLGFIKSEDVIREIDYSTRATALGFMSKQELFDSIYVCLKDENETRRIFKELDSSILVPNNLEGAPEQELDKDTEEDYGEVDDEEHENGGEGDDKEYEDDGEEGGEVASGENALKTQLAQQIKDDKYSENTTETAEDILKEVENPTPAPSVVANTPQTTEVPSEATTTTTTTTTTKEGDLLLTKTNTATPEITPTKETPTQQNNTINTPNTEAPTSEAQNKEVKLDSKLTESVVQPVKSTYYKVDPYREQPEL